LFKCFFYILTSFSNNTDIFNLEDIFYFFLYEEFLPKKDLETLFIKTKII